MPARVRMMLEILVVRNFVVWDTPRRSTTTTVTCCDDGDDGPHGSAMKNPPFGPRRFEDVDAVHRRRCRSRSAFTMFPLRIGPFVVDDLEPVHRDVDAVTPASIRSFRIAFPAVLDQHVDQGS